MAETKKTEAAAAAAPPEAACLTLRQKLVEMRKACPEIVKKQHSDGVSYKYAKIYDVWEKITPIMNELGVDFDVISEQATRHAENGAHALLKKLCKRRIRFVDLFSVFFKLIHADFPCPSP